MGNKISDKITKVSKNVPHNNSEPVTNGEERYISPVKRLQTINDLRLI